MIYLIWNVSQLFTSAVYGHMLFVVCENSPHRSDALKPFLSWWSFSGFLFPKWWWHPNSNLSSVPWFDSSKVLKVVCVRCLKSQTPGGATFNSRASTITRAVSMGDLVASTTIVSVTSPHTSESYYTCERITSRIQISRASAVPTPSATVLHHEITIQCAREIKFMWGEHEKKYAWERENEWGGDSFPLIYSFSLITSPPPHIFSHERAWREKRCEGQIVCACARHS